MAQRRKRPRRIDVDLREQIEEWARAKTMSGPQIVQRLELDDRYATRVPSLRTVQSVMREAEMPTIRTDDEVWTVATATPGEAEHVLPVLGCVIDMTAGRVTQLRRDHAAWVARIRGAVPRLGEWRIYLEAGQYVNAIERGASTNAIDSRLARLAWEPIAAIQEAEGEAWVRGQAATVSWTPAAMRGMTRVPDEEVAPDFRWSVEQARRDLEERNND